MATAIRKYEMCASNGARAEFGRRLSAERTAEELYKLNAVRGTPTLVSVFAHADDGSRLVFALEPVPEGVLVTRLRGRLRPPRINRRQLLCLRTIAAHGAGVATRDEIVATIGRYGANSFKSCLTRALIRHVGDELYELTPEGRELLAHTEAHR